MLNSWVLRSSFPYATVPQASCRSLARLESAQDVHTTIYDVIQHVPEMPCHNWTQSWGAAWAPLIWRLLCSFLCLPPLPAGCGDQVSFCTKGSKESCVNTQPRRALFSSRLWDGCWNLFCWKCCEINLCGRIFLSNVEMSGVNCCIQRWASKESWTPLKIL